MKKLFILLIICIFFFCKVHSQNNKYNIELYLRPSINYRILYSENKEIIDMLKGTHKIGATLDYGLLFNRNINEYTKLKYLYYQPGNDTTIYIKGIEEFNDISSRIYNPSIAFSYGFEWQFGNEISLLIQPTFDIMILGSNTKYSNINQNLFEFGINFQLMKIKSSL